MNRIIAILFGLTALTINFQAVAFQDSGEPFAIELMSEVDSVAPRRPFWVAISIDIEKAALIPWRLPGSGLQAPTLTWTLPPGFTIGRVRWPGPSLRTWKERERRLFLAGPRTLLAEIKPPDRLGPDESYSIALQIDSALCYAKCAPRTAAAELTLPAGAGQVNEDATVLFEQARNWLPLYMPWPVRATAGPEQLELEIYMEQDEAARIENVIFYPYRADLIDLSKLGPVSPEITEDGILLRLARPESAPLVPRVAGLIQFYTTEDRAPPFEINVANAIPPMPTTIAPLRGVENLSFWLAIAFAFLGGLILNLMPCVFPVIAMKAFSLVKSSDAPLRQRLSDAVSYSFGIVLTFLAVASVLLILKGVGNEVGWGFQLQSPDFVLILIVILSAVMFNFLGLLELRMPRAISAPHGGGPITSFLTGALAVVVATPCTAPFMAPAIGFALVQSGSTALATFTALGLGMAAPYLILSVVPALGHVLPRPGPWMVRLRQWLALPIAATIVWLIWVLATQSGKDGAILGALAVALALVGVGIYRTFPSWHPDRRITGVAGLVILVFLFSIYANKELKNYTGMETGLEQRGSITVVPFSTARLATIRSEGRPVFLYFTATWCVTCLVNERFVLENPKFQEFLLSHGIVLMEGDWTNPNDEIASLLGDFGRSGIPFNVFYPPGRESDPVIFPEILTLNSTLERLTRLTQDSV